jgi:hypothetical protein
LQLQRSCSGVTYAPAAELTTWLGSRPRARQCWFLGTSILEFGQISACVAVAAGILRLVNEASQVSQQNPLICCLYTSSVGW